MDMHLEALNQLEDGFLNGNGCPRCSPRGHRSHVIEPTCAESRTGISDHLGGAQIS